MVVGILALVFAMGGTALAVVGLNAKQKIQVKQLANKQIKAKAPGLSVAKAKDADHATNADKATSADKATNADHAVNADQAANADKVGGAGLDSFTIGRSTTGSCDPASSAFVDCGTVSLNLPRPGRVLIIATAGFDGANSAAGYRGDCRLTADGTVVGSQVSNGSSTGTGVGFNGNAQATTALSAVTASLPTGTHDLALTCNQAGGSVEFSGNSVSAVMVGSG
jgi:hypothetical protein